MNDTDKSGRSFPNPRSESFNSGCPNREWQNLEHVPASAGVWHPRPSAQMSKDKNAVGRNYSVCATYRLSQSLLPRRRKPFRRRSQQPSNFVCLRFPSERSISRKNREQRTFIVSVTDFEQFICVCHFSEQYKKIRICIYVSVNYTYLSHIISIFYIFNIFLHTYLLPIDRITCLCSLCNKLN